MKPILLTVLATLVVLSTGCARTADLPAVALPSQAPTTAAASTPTEEATEPAPKPAGPATVARANGDVEVFVAPGAAVPDQILPATTSFGTRTVLLVTDVGHDDTAGWLQVLLPVRPNGATGWIRAADVQLREVTLEVHVDLQARELTVLDDGEVILTTPTAIGTDEHPTPTGMFYVTDKLETGEPDGVYGPYALGLSARSEVLDEFGGGDGQVGIHGTNQPDSIGQAASHGCLRIDNDVVTELAHLLPLGTPVIIT